MAPDRSATSHVEEHLELARAIADVFADPDPDTAERLFHPELQFHDAWAVGPGIYRGLAGMRQLHRDFSAAWEDFRFELLELQPTPDGRVFMAARQRVRRKTTSREIDRTMYFLLAFRDGKLVRWDGWHLRAVARGAAGLED
ncbi:MAG: nuclear transport factor 2 family protein [Thermoleophilaceae bacterium]